MSKLRRVLGLPSLLFYGVGVVVGAGVYALIGAAAEEAGRMLWLSMLLAAVPATLAALCYAEMATRYPRAGGAYVYIRHAFPKLPWLGFIVGWATAVTTAATAATVAIGFAGYLSLFVDVPRWLAAMLLLTACTGVAVAGVRESAWVAAACTVIEVGGLVAIVVLGVGADGFGERLLDAGGDGGGKGVQGVLAGAALTFFVYTGFEGLANLAEESRRPRRDLPLALLISLGVTVALYLLVSLAVVALVSPEELAASDSPLATAAAAKSATVATALGWVALFSTANTALITLVVGARVVFGVADAGDLPPALARTLRRRATPWAASAALLVASLALLPLGGIGLVGSVSSLTTLVVFAAVGAALIRVRLRPPEETRKEPSRDGEARPFMVPGSIARVPLAPVLLLLTMAPLLLWFEPAAHAVAGATLGAGMLVYATRRWWGAAPTASEAGRAAR
ncbi:MAG TPA: APC family permease [Phycisphaerales bacterium]|nr:APC family permease [Phycisphaerales bacterium]